MFNFLDLENKVSEKTLKKLSDDKCFSEISEEEALELLELNNNMKDETDDNNLQN